MASSELDDLHSDTKPSENFKIIENMDENEEKIITDKMSTKDYQCYFCDYSGEASGTNDYTNLYMHTKRRHSTKMNKIPKIPNSGEKFRIRSFICLLCK